MSDATLIHEIQGGSNIALETLFTKYQESIRRIAICFLGNKLCVDDVVQEVFISLQKSIQNYESRSKFSTWLFSLVRNVSMQYIKKNIKNVLEYDDALHGQATYQDQNPDLLILNKSLQKISSKYREPLLLKEVEGFSYDEIAQILSIREGTVKSRIHEAKKKLLTIMNKGV